MSTSNLPVDARPARSAQSSEAGGAGAGESRKPFVCGTLTPQQLADQSGTSGSPMQKQAAASETLSSTGSSEAETVRDSAKPTGLVMQIILRRDLLTKHGWPVGPLLAQSAHAATAVLHLYKDHADVKRYLEGEDGRGWKVMRKVTYEVEDEAALRGIADELDKAEGKGKVGYHLWIEQPENIPTALALVPNKRPKQLKAILDDAGCKLFG